MSVELNPWAGVVIDGLATALHPGGVYRLNVELRLSPGAQRLHFMASKQVGHERAQSVQFESSAAQGLVVLSAVDAALTAVQEMPQRENCGSRPLLCRALTVSKPWRKY